MATHSSILVWRIPRDRGAWWATVHRVAQSRTQLKWFNTQVVPTNAKMNNGPTTKEAYFTHTEAWAGGSSQSAAFSASHGDAGSCFLPFCASVIPQGSGSQTVHKAPHGSQVNSQNYGELSLKCEGITAILGISWIQYHLLDTGSFAQH